MSAAQLATRLQRLLGKAGLLNDAAARVVYARDASHLKLGRPLAVALPADTAEAAAVVAACAAAGVPVVARGAGTGLSGGAVPADGELVLATGRLNALGPIDDFGHSVRAAAGVINETVSRRAGRRGLHFAPDPSSQSAATIGGNIAENAGGPHCLRHGVTLQHVRRLEWVDAEGVVRSTGHGCPGERGFDLVSLLCGAEGTLGVVTAADLALTPDPADVATLLAFFPVLDEATAAVVRLLGQGLLPVAVEMIDQAMLGAVEEAFGFGFPTDVAGAMIVEFAGSPDEVAEDAAAARGLLAEAGAREVRLAADAQERAELWKCRKKAFGAVGRLAPSYVTMDVVVPLGQLPGLVAGIQRIKAEHGVEVATAFHAGDGNLHPGVHYDDRDPESSRRAHAAADAIIADALARGGSATGEHGVGIEKLHVLPWQMDPVAADLHLALKHAADPSGLFNPGKALPDPTAEFAACPPVPTAVDVSASDLTVTAPATALLSELQAAAAPHGLWVPVGLPGGGAAYGLDHDPTVAELLDHLLPGPLLLSGATARDVLLESWAETGDGRVFHSGARVFKNVAGYALHHALCGSGGVYARHLAASFALKPVPQAVAILDLATPRATAAKRAALDAWLAGRDGVARPTALHDGAESRVIIPGRDRSWDLQRLGAAAQNVLGDAGWQVTSCRVEAWGADLGQHCGIPAWARSADGWSAAGAAPGADPREMPLPERCVVASGLRRLWWPGTAAADGTWPTESIILAGRPTLPAAPAPGVPRGLLRRIKAVFDPAGALPTPTWLAEPTEARDE